MPNLTNARVLPVLLTLGLVTGCAAAIDPEIIEDAQTAARVKTVLVNDPDLGGRTIEVRVAAGVVQLSGRVASSGEVARAIELSRAVPGVRDVRSSLQVGIEAPPAGSREPGPDRGVEVALVEPADAPRLLAVGVTVSRSQPRVEGFSPRITAGPLLKLGSGRGLGVALGLNWFQTELTTTAGAEDSVSRVSVKPFMAGIGYTFGPEHVALSISLIAGLAFNSLTIVTPAADLLAVDVGNSIVWRPGISLWHDITRRTAFNVSAGYIRTRLPITFVEGGRVETRRVSGDTAVISAGLAYRLF